MGARKYLKTMLKGIKHWLDEDANQPTPEIRSVPFDNRYEWLTATHEKLMDDPLWARKSQYGWGVLQGAALGKVLGMEQISVIEFGVAGGAGLLALEHIADRCEELVNIRIDVYGFDTGGGLPKPQDYRDCPYFWLEGQYPIDWEQLTKRLRRASLKLGFVKDTVPAFIDSLPAPVAFVAFDLDLYSSTKDALSLFDAKHQFLLPRIACYFDDIMGESWSDYTGERLAITEFNNIHPMRKLSPIHGLSYWVPTKSKSRDWVWPEKFYFAHMFDHPLYNTRDAMRKPMVIDTEGKES